MLLDGTYNIPSSSNLDKKNAEDDKIGGSTERHVNFVSDEQFSNAISSISLIHAGNTTSFNFQVRMKGHAPIQDVSHSLTCSRG